MRMSTGNDTSMPSRGMYDDQRQNDDTEDPHQIDRTRIENAILAAMKELATSAHAADDATETISMIKPFTIDHLFKLRDAAQKLLELTGYVKQNNARNNSITESLGSEAVRLGWEKLDRVYDEPKQAADPTQSDLSSVKVDSFTSLNSTEVQRQVQEQKEILMAVVKDISHSQRLDAPFLSQNTTQAADQYPNGSSQSGTLTPDFPPALEVYYGKAGEVKWRHERVLDRQIEYDEVKSARLFRVEQELLEDSTEDEEEKLLRERLTDEIQARDEAIADRDAAREACLELGLDPDARPGKSPHLPQMELHEISSEQFAVDSWLEENLENYFVTEPLLSEDPEPDRPVLRLRHSAFSVTEAAAGAPLTPASDPILDNAPSEPPPPIFDDQVAKAPKKRRKRPGHRGGKKKKSKQKPP